MLLIPRASGGHIGKMSGVHENDRGVTGFAPVDYAAMLQDEITRYVMNENRCPKKWRYVLGVDLIRKADEIFDSVSYANKIWLKPETVKARKKYWVRASAQLEQLDRRLNRMKKLIPTATPDSMKEVFKYLNADRVAVSERIRNER